MKVKELLESRYRGSMHAGWAMSQKSSARGQGLAAKSEDEDPSYHREQIEELSHAISTNPDWAKSMLPKMQSQLEYHQKRLKELTV